MPKENKILIPPEIFVIMQYTLREVVQNRLLWIVLFFALIGIGGAAFVGDLAIIENRAVETSLLAAAYRFCAVFVMVIVVISTIVREFNDKCLVLYFILAHIARHLFCRKTCRILYRRYHSGVHFFLNHGLLR